MKKTIIRNNLMLLLGVFLLFFVLFFSVLYYLEENQQKAYMEYLLDEVEISYLLFEGEPIDFVSTYISSSDRRITILDEDRFVIADSHDESVGTDKSLRPEIKNLGTVYTRRSATVNMDLQYIAKKLEDGNYLRVSIALEPQIIIYQRVILIFTLGGLILIASYAYGLMKINQNLLKPWYQVRKGLLALNQGQYQMMSLTNPYPEINEILHEMNLINIETAMHLNTITAYKLQLDKILNEMKQGVLLINREDEITYLNDDAKEMLEITDDALNKKAYQFIRYHLINEAIEEANKNHQSKTFDLTHKSKTYEIKVFFIAERTVQKQDATVLILIKDITQERAMEQMKKDFFSHASHELKSPLTAIKGHAELIAHHIVKGDDIKKSTEQIISQTETMTLLVEDMLMLSRLENLKEKKYQLHDLEIILKEVISSLSTTSQNKNIQIKTKSMKIEMMCDSLDMQKLFKNLVENAIKYSEKDKEINIELKRDQDQVIFVVKDQGIGISIEHQERVFERFYRVDKGRLDGGTGLGLAIVKHIVMKYDGTIKLESGLSKGTKITIKLKLSM